MSMKEKITVLEKNMHRFTGIASKHINSSTEYPLESIKRRHLEKSDNSDDDLPQSKIRIQNVPLLNEVDKRYEGKKISRKDLDNEKKRRINNDSSTEYFDEESQDEFVETENEDERSDEGTNEENEESGVDISERNDNWTSQKRGNKRHYNQDTSMECQVSDMEVYSDYTIGTSEEEQEKEVKQKGNKKKEVEKKKGKKAEVKRGEVKKVKMQKDNEVEADKEKKSKKVDKKKKGNKKQESKTDKDNNDNNNVTGGNDEKDDNNDVDGCSGSDENSGYDSDTMDNDDGGCSGSDDGDNMDNDDDCHSGSYDNNASDNDEHSDNSVNDSDDEYDENDEECSIDTNYPLLRSRQLDDNFKTMSDSNVNADIEKGKCVKSQLKVWEYLLELRIQLQKLLHGSNQMPQYDVYKNFAVKTEFMNKNNETKNMLSDVLDKMLKLQVILLRQFPETKDMCLSFDSSKSGKRKAEEVERKLVEKENPSETDGKVGVDNNIQGNVQSQVDTIRTNNEVPVKKRKLLTYEETLAERYASYTDFRNSVIQKWNDKTRIITGSVNKGAQLSVLKQIEFALRDKDKIRKKTQLQRTAGVVLGKAVREEEDNVNEKAKEYDPEIYDDSEFYQQLIRELIEQKCSDITDPVQLSKYWIQLQSARSKMKKQIDTKATKGRRVRYNVHNKLVNFMAPITTCDTWTDSAKNELYSSLFDKVKPTKQKNV